MQTKFLTKQSGLRTGDGDRQAHICATLAGPALFDLQDPAPQPRSTNFALAMEAEQ